MCTRACVSACVCAYVRACVRVSLLEITWQPLDHSTGPPVDSLPLSLSLPQRKLLIVIEVGTDVPRNVSDLTTMSSII